MLLILKKLLGISALHKPRNKALHKSRLLLQEVFFICCILANLQQYTPILLESFYQIHSFCVGVFLQVLSSNAWPGSTDLMLGPIVLQDTMALPSSDLEATCSQGSNMEITCMQGILSSPLS